MMNTAFICRQVLSLCVYVSSNAAICVYQWIRERNVFLFSQRTAYHVQSENGRGRGDVSFHQNAMFIE